MDKLRKPLVTVPISERGTSRITSTERCFSTNQVGLEVSASWFIITPPQLAEMYDLTRWIVLLKQE